jgi:hypothetical protein
MPWQGMAMNTLFAGELVQARERESGRDVDAHQAAAELF